MVTKNPGVQMSIVMILGVNVSSRFSGTGSPRLSWKRGHKMVAVLVVKVFNH